MMDAQTQQYIDGKFETVNTKLDNINAHLFRQNGSINHHTEQINEALTWRAKKYTEIDDKFKIYDSIVGDVNKLKEESINTKALKTYNARLFVLSTTIISIIIAAIGLWLHAGMGK